MVFRWIAPLRRDSFGPKTQLSKAVDKVLEFKQYFLAYFLRNLASNTPEEFLLRALCQHTKGVMPYVRHYMRCNL